MAEVKVTLEVGNDGVAIITFSNPPANALAVQSELRASFDSVESCVFLLYIKFLFWLRFVYCRCSYCRVEGEIWRGDQKKWCESYRFDWYPFELSHSMPFEFAFSFWYSLYGLIGLKDLYVGDCEVVVSAKGTFNYEIFLEFSWYVSSIGFWERRVLLK